MTRNGFLNTVHVLNDREAQVVTADLDNRGSYVAEVSARHLDPRILRHYMD